MSHVEAAAAAIAAINTSPSERNAQVLKAMYTAFAAGNVPGILEHLDENVEWNCWQEPQVPSTVAAQLPWLQPKRGHAGAVVSGVQEGNVDC